MSFNIFFTSLPILVYGLLEQDYSANKLLRFPQYYKLNRKNHLLSGCQTFVWILIGELYHDFMFKPFIIPMQFFFFLGIWQTCAVYFSAYFYWLINPVISYDNTPADFWSFSTCVFHLVTLVINLQVSSNLLKENCHF